VVSKGPIWSDSGPKSNQASADIEAILGFSATFLEGVHDILLSRREQEMRSSFLSNTAGKAQPPHLDDPMIVQVGSYAIFRAWGRGGKSIIIIGAGMAGLAHETGRRSPKP
jgi:hypothetical protein